MQKAFATTAEMVNALRAAGVNATDAQALAARAKPYSQIECARADDEAEIALGATKIGGAPDLPAGMPWPWRSPYPDHQQRLEDLRHAIDRMNQRVETESFSSETIDEIKKALPPGAFNEQIEEFVASLKKSYESMHFPFEDFANDLRRTSVAAPLAFIAQIDLAAVWSAGPADPDIPRDGRLLFFYDTASRPEGNRPADVTGARLIYDLTSAAALKRAVPPAELMQIKRDGTFPAQRCVMRAAISPPSHGSLAWEACAMKGKSKAAAEKWWWDHTDGSHDHRFGGHPIQIQGYDMQLQCALVSKGLSYGSRTAEVFKSAARNWLLLMQIASDKSARMMWGDMGNLYVWIHRDALRARRFEEARVISQCF
jgi:hypothetical protein